MKKHQIFYLFTSCVLFSAAVSAADSSGELAAYCREKGGEVKVMKVPGQPQPTTKEFCTFQRDSGYIVIGLSAFASPEPSIAATYIKKLPEFKENSSLMQGALGNPSYKVCQNLGGTAMSYQGTEGGESDICVFSDESMVSAWSLIYMANHRKGYDEVKANVLSQPLDIPMPKN